MSFTLQVGSIITTRVRLTGSSATALVDRDERVTVVGIEAVNRTTGTPDLTIDVNDGTTTWYKRNAEALASKERVFLDNVFVLERKQVLRATSSSATGDIDFEVTYQVPDKALTAR